MFPLLTRGRVVPLSQALDVCVLDTKDPTTSYGVCIYMFIRTSLSRKANVTCASGEPVKKTPLYLIISGENTRFGQIIMGKV